MADSTLRRSPQLERLRQQASKAVAQNAAVMFRHTLSFTLGQYAPWVVRCAVTDPQRLSPAALARLQATAAEQKVSYQDLRVLKVHPDDTVPFPGATVPWDGGTLEILSWSQESDFIVGRPEGEDEEVGMRTGTAVLRRP